MQGFDDLDPGEKYGLDFERNLEKALEIINRDIDRIVVGIQEAKASGTQEASLQYLLANRRQLEDAIAGTVSSALTKTVSEAYKDLLGISSEELKARGIDGDFLPSDVKAFENSNQNISVWFETASRESARGVFNALMNYVVTGSQGRLLEFVANMTQEKYFRYGPTIVHSHLNAFYQQANNIRSARAGVVRYRYLGPTPRREFCSALIGKVFYIDEIKAMDNGQTGDVFHTCGGYNCRHRWVPIAPTARDQSYQKPSVEAVKEKLEEVKVGDGSLFDAGRGKILVRSKGANLGLIQRSIYQDEKGSYYRRFTGDKEYLKKDSAGRFYIEAFVPQRVARTAKIPRTSANSPSGGK